MGLQAKDRIRIGWFSAVSGPMSASVRASAEILQEGRDVFEIEMFLDDMGLQALEERSPGVPEIFYEQHTEHYLRAFKRDQENPFDLFVYHLEDLPSALYIRHAMVMFPGICFAHDQYFMRFESFAPWALTGELQGKREIGRDPKLGDFQGLVVSNSAHALQVLQTEYGFNNREQMPLPFRLPNESHRAQLRRTFRERYALLPNDIVVACFGASGVAGRTTNVVESFLRIVSRDGNGRLFWLVADEDEKKEALSALALRSVRETDDIRELIAATIQVLPVSSFQILEEALCGSDLATIVEYDPRHNSVPLIDVAMGCGIPTMALEIGRTLELPEGAIVGIHPGLGESREIREKMNVLFRNTELREIIGARAQAYAQEVLAPCSVLEDLKAIIDEHGEWLSRVLQASRESFAAEISRGTENGISVMGRP